MPVVGPQLPPHLADKRKRDDSDDSTLPTAADANKPHGGPQPPGAATTKHPQPSPTPPAVPKRDEWMTMAPTSSDWSARIDPTKLKNRKFTTSSKKTGSSSAASAAAASAAWHETPEQKQARLQRELMGVNEDEKRLHTKTHHAHGYDEQEQAAARKRIKEYQESTRGPSLYEAHQQQKRARKEKQGSGGRGGDNDVDEDEDDPSARPFDRERDIARGLQMNSTRRRELVQKASDFGSRFSAAKYLEMPLLRRSPASRASPASPESPLGTLTAAIL
ncbi:hypothetical protein DV735_g4818, partial [Chaetothyriales sp. CBS 134920]